jgi:hypothetical protein
VGIRYAFEIVTDRTSIESLSQAIAKHLEPKDRTRFLAAAKVSSERVMEVIPRDDLEFRLSEMGNEDICLTFLFPPDESVVAYGSVAKLDDPQTGRLAIGCVWSWIRCGERYGLFRAAAATSGMSRLFEQSQSIRETFVQIAKEAGASLLLLDIEQDKCLGIWPREDELASLANSGEVSDPLIDPLEIDRYCSALLAGAGNK